MSLEQKTSEAMIIFYVQHLEK